jgi:hypothetical protein
MATTKEKLQGKTVQLASGERVQVLPWPFLEANEHGDLIRSVLRDSLGAVRDNLSPVEFSAALTANVGRLAPVITGSLSEEDAGKLRGMNDPMLVLEAALEVNEVFKALGKAQSLILRLATETNNQTNT